MISTSHFCRILIKFEYSRTDFRKKAQISSFIKIRPMGAKLFHTDKRTDMTKLTVAFRNFANAPKNSLYSLTMSNQYRRNAQVCGEMKVIKE
jgi:hypothetical protein